MCGADRSPVPPLPRWTARQACCHGRAPTPSVPRRTRGPGEPWDGPGPPLPLCCVHCHCQAPQGSAHCPSHGPPGGLQALSRKLHRHPGRQSSGSPTSWPACVLSESSCAPCWRGVDTQYTCSGVRAKGALLEAVGAGPRWPAQGSSSVRPGAPCPVQQAHQGPEQTPQPSLQRLASAVLLPTVYSDPEQVTRDMQAPWAHGSLTCIATLTLGSSQSTAPRLPGQGWAQ